MADILELNSFTPLLGQSLKLSADSDTTYEVELVEASPLPNHNNSEREPFSLVFRGPCTPQLAQATYPIEHPELGSVQIFIVPISADEQGVCYEAVFA